jgi:DNA-directed RNA polymerase subunit RPC12/RpoP
VSRSAGPGSPYYFRCARCKTRTSRSDGKRGMNYVATGNVRPPPRRKHHARGIRSADQAYEYRCLDCGHTGWSQHSDMERAYKRRSTSTGRA